MVIQMPIHTYISEKSTSNMLSVPDSVCLVSDTMPPIAEALPAAVAAE